MLLLAAFVNCAHLVLVACHTTVAWCMVPSLVPLMRQSLARFHLSHLHKHVGVWTDHWRAPDPVTYQLVDTTCSSLGAIRRCVQTLDESNWQAPLFRLRLQIITQVKAAQYWALCLSCLPYYRLHRLVLRSTLCFLVGRLLQPLLQPLFQPLRYIHRARVIRTSRYIIDACD
jgi:hypothetical protein